jgi:uncharacterized protein DUF6599
VTEGFSWVDGHLKYFNSNNASLAARGAMPQISAKPDVLVPKDLRHGWKAASFQNPNAARVFLQPAGPGQTSFGGAKAHGVLLVVLGIVLLLDASCKRRPVAEQSFFPASNQVAGWVKTGEIRTFEAADLWKYIDGEAERYLKAGVRRVSTTDYKFQNKVEAVVDIYTLGDAEGAEKVFKSEPALGVKPIQLGDDAHLSSQGLVFRKGAYLVRIIAYEESAETQQALLQLGHDIEVRLAQ